MFHNKRALSVIFKFRLSSNHSSPEQNLIHGGNGYTLTTKRLAGSVWCSFQPRYEVFIQRELLAPSSTVFRVFEVTTR